MKRVLLSAVLLLVLGIALAMGWLLNSESGLHWAYRQADALLPGELRSQRLTGSLNDGVTLQGIEYQDDEVRFTAERVILHWNPWALLMARIDIPRLAAEQLEVELLQSGDNSAAAGTELVQLDLPLELRLHELEIDRLRLNRGGTPVTLEQLKLRATSRGSKLDITAFSVRVVEVAISESQVNDFEINLAGDIDASGAYPHELDIDWQTRLPAGDIVDNSMRIAGDLASTRLIHQTSGPLQAKLTLALQDLLGSPKWQAELEVASHFGEPPGLHAAGSKRQHRIGCKRRPALGTGSRANRCRVVRTWPVQRQLRPAQPRPFTIAGRRAGRNAAARHLRRKTRCKGETLLGADVELGD